MRSLLLLLPALSVVSGYRILCVFPIPTPSHNILDKGVVKALLQAGHQVTWVTPYPFTNKDKNLTLIRSETEMLGRDRNMADPKLSKAGIPFVREFARNISLATLGNELLRRVLTDEQFDAVCTEWFFSPLDAGYAAIQRVPWIMLSAVTYNAMLEDIVDVVRSVSTVPMLLSDAPVPMSLMDRLVNTVSYLMIAFGDFVHSSTTEADYNSLYSPLAAARGIPLPPFSAVKNNVSILLVNSHPSIVATPPVPANVVQIAGYHIPEDVPPPCEGLQTILENSTNGVVYFSMGSVIKSSNLPETTLRDLIRILGDLPYTVLWKFEAELEGLPKNVHIQAWMPQNTILAHPNVRLFISHGGMLSCLEAMHFGVPLLAIPVFADQPSNAARATQLGYAKTVPFSHDMGPKLQETLNEMLADDKYYKRAKYLSKLFRNREVPPSKLISHYIEVAIQSKGAYHLRSPSHLYVWYERWMLDQAAVVLAVLALLAVIVRKLFSLCSPEKKRKEKRH